MKHHLHAEHCKRHYLNSEWIVYLEGQFEACFEQNIENDNKHIFFQETMIHKVFKKRSIISNQVVPVQCAPPILVQSIKIGTIL